MACGPEGWRWCWAGPAGGDGWQAGGAGWACAHVGGRIAPAAGHAGLAWSAAAGRQDATPARAGHRGTAYRHRRHRWSRGGWPICRRWPPSRSAAPAPPEHDRRAGLAGAISAAGDIYRARYRLLKDWLYTPPIVPHTQHFAQKITPKNCAKKLPHVPPKGGLGNGFRGIDGAKNRRYHSGQAEATRPTPPGLLPGKISRGQVNGPTRRTV